MNIQFPVDFEISENPFLMFAKNYIHQRKDGTIISILESASKPGQYEIWDEKWMDDIEIKTSREIQSYLQKESIRVLLAQINLN